MLVEGVRRAIGAFVTGNPTVPEASGGADAPQAVLFQLLPSPYMILDRDLRYVDVSDAYCTVLERRPEDLIGAYLFDAQAPARKLCSAWAKASG